MHKLHAMSIYCAVAFSGVIVMVFELVGARIMAAYAGTTTLAWSAIIGVIMASLSVGYWIGGRLTKKETSSDRLALFLLLSAVAMLVTAWIHQPFLAWLSALGLHPGSVALIASIILFAPASLFLGAILTYSVGLLVSKLENSGRMVGNLYSSNSIGSILGTFLAGFYLIPNFRSSSIVFALVALLALFSLLLFASTKSWRGALATFTLLLLSIGDLVYRYFEQQNVVEYYFLR